MKNELKKMETVGVETGETRNSACTRKTTREAHHFLSSYATCSVVQDFVAILIAGILLAQQHCEIPRTISRGALYPSRAHVVPTATIMLSMTRAPCICVNRRTHRPEWIGRERRFPTDEPHAGDAGKASLRRPILRSVKRGNLSACALTCNIVFAKNCVDYFSAILFIRFHFLWRD